MAAHATLCVGRTRFFFLKATGFKCSDRYLNNTNTDSHDTAADNETTFYYFTTRQRTPELSLNVLVSIWSPTWLMRSSVSLQAMFNGASTASVSWMSSSIFSTSLSPYRTLTTSIIPVINLQSQSPQLTPASDRPYRATVFFKLRDLGCCVTFIGSFLAFFRVNLWFFLLCCYITVPSLTDRYYRHTLAASLNYSTQAHTETHRIGVNSDPTEMRKRMT